MPKSKYPNQLDTSIEIPAVRDNITEIGSDVINSLRSAILQIEKTLGVNPQGAAGNTLSSRLANIIDDNGNLLKDALDRSNVLSGPILDSDVSSVAAIREKKLRLDFPTQLLQDEISIINGQLDNIIEQLAELNRTILVHINPNATNRHSGVSITINSAATVPSDISTQSLGAGTSQSTFEEIYNSHINYSGTSITSSNNSHLANQIYFNNENVDLVIPSDDVQGALEDAALAGVARLRNSVLNLSSNGRIRTGSILDAFEGNSRGAQLLNTTASYVQASGDSTTTFSLSAATAPTNSINQFDILEVSGAFSEDDDKDYQIKSVLTNGSGQVISIEVFGGPAFPSAGAVAISVFKNIYTIYNRNGLNCSVRPRSNRTNTPDVQVANPNSATIISNGIQSAKITSTENTFSISIDGGSALDIETFDNAIAVQSLDSIVNKINEQSVDQHLNIMAYKIRVGTCYELAIAHNVPNISGDTTNRTIQITNGSSNDGTSELGFSEFLDIEYEGTSNNTFNINGYFLDEFGLVQQLSGLEVSISTGTNRVELLGNDFSDLGVRIGDIIVVTGSTDSSDDGSFRVKRIINEFAEVDLSGFVFTGELDSSSIVHIIRNSALVAELNFTESAGIDGSIMFDVFITDQGDINYTKRMEIEGTMSSGPFVAGVVDVSRSFITSGQIATIDIDTDGFATLTGPSLLAGESVFVAADGVYKLFSNDKLSFVTINVVSTGDPSTAINVTLYGFDEISQNNLILSRGLFATSLGKVLGRGTDSGVPSVVDKRRSGTVDETIVSESLLEKYIEGPRNELRSSGVIRGCSVSNVVDLGTYQTFALAAGIVIANGIRYELKGYEEFKADTDQDFYVAIDGSGCVLVGESIPNPNPGGTGNVSPFYNLSVAHIAFVEASTGDITDLRIFVDHLDYKVIGDIKISNDQRFGHFTDIKSGVDYARRFSELFPDLKPPSIFIDEGTHLVSENILIDFDVSIRGAGPSTVIQKSGSLASGVSLGGGTNVDFASSVFLVGGGTNLNSTDITYGVSFSDFTYQATDDLVSVGAVIAITQITNGIDETDVDTTSTFRVQNINFIGVDDMSTTKGEYAVIIGRADSASPFTPGDNFVIGNIHINSCYFSKMGLDKGPVRFVGGVSSGFSAIFMIGNSSMQTSSIGWATSGILEDPPVVNLFGVIESSNVIMN